MTNHHQAFLARIDPEANCFRFYQVGIEPNLFGDHSLVIHWGRLGRRGRTRIAASGPLEHVAAIADRIERQKVKKGYEHSPLA